MKTTTRTLAALITLLSAFTLHAAPWALWDDFTGADAVNGLAPQTSSTLNNVNGGNWRLKLAGEASVNADGSLQTGTTAPAKIDFGGTLNLGYDTNPFSIVITVKNVPATPLNKPLWHAGNGSLGVGVGVTAMDISAGTASLRGSWFNDIWNDVRVNANELAARDTEFTFVGYAHTPLQLFKITDGAISVLGNISGLQGTGLTSTGVHFGNFVNATSGGLNFTITRVAVYRGAISAAEIPAYVADYTHPKWQGTGDGSGTWNLATDNLAWLHRNASVAYKNTTPAIFEDLNGVDAASVTIAAAVNPSTVLIDNESTDYTFLFNSAATVPGAITKSGDGAVTLGGAAVNVLNGGFVLTGGTATLASATKNKTLNILSDRGAQLTIRNGTLDLGMQSNWNNASIDTWITEKVITLGGAEGNAELANGKLETFNNANTFVYDASNNAGTATVSAFWKSTGSSSASAKKVTVGDGRDDVDLRFTGGIGLTSLPGTPIAQAQKVTLEKAGLGTMEIACVNVFSRLTISAGRVLLGASNALGKRWQNDASNLVTVNANLDLGGFDQSIEYLAGNASGVITSTAPATLSVGYGSAVDGSSLPYAGAIQGAVTIQKTGTTTLRLTGSIDTTGTLIAPEGTKLTVVTAINAESAAIKLGSAPEMAGLTLDISNATALDKGVYPVMSWEGALLEGAALPTGALPGQSFTLNTERTVLLFEVTGDRYWVSGDGDWLGSNAWRSAEEEGSAVDFAAGSSAILTAQGGGTITVDSEVSANRLAVAGNYTLSGEGPLLLASVEQNAATALTLAVPFTVFGSTSMGDGASLTVGASATFNNTVLGNGASLTLNAPATFNNSVSGDSASLTVNATTTFNNGILGTGNVTTTADTLVSLNSLGSTTLTMPTYTANSGTLTISKTQSSDGIFSGAPLFTVAAGAKIILSGNDIVGWGHPNTVNIATISGTLEKQVVANETFSGQLTLRGNAEVKNSGSDDKFMFHNSTKLLVSGEAADAHFTGNRFKTNNGTTTIEVTDASSKLTFDAALNVAAPIDKAGAGTLVLAGAVNGNGVVTVNGGTMVLNGATSVGGTVTVNGGTMMVNGSWTGGGQIWINADGAICGTGALTAYATSGWLRGAGTFEGGINGKGTLTTDELRPFDGARFRVVISEDGSTCGLIKTGSLLFGATLTVLPEGLDRATGKSYTFLETDALNASTDLVLADSVDQSQWVLVKRVAGAKVAWSLKRRQGVLVTIQ